MYIYCFHLNRLDGRFCADCQAELDQASGLGTITANKHRDDGD